MESKPLEIFLNPQGKIKSADNAFFSKGNGLGLIALLQSKQTGRLTPGQNYFRRFAKDWVSRLCCLNDLATDRLERCFSNAQAPEDYLQRFLLDAPLILGAEYISLDFLVQLQSELEQSVREELSRNSLSLEDYIRSLSSAWKDVGKVSFHLAENKGMSKESYPFAFMATYVHQISESDTARHLPLSTAIKGFSSDSRALKNLLSPIQQAAKNSALIQSLLESRQIFSPCALSVAQAVDFLKDIPVFQEANIVVRYTQIWKSQPPQTKVSVRADMARKSAIGLKSLMEFSAAVSLNGEELSEDEINELMNSSDGLVRLKGQWVRTEPEKIRALLSQWNKIQNTKPGLSFIEGFRLINAATDGTSQNEKLDSDLCQIEPAGKLKKLLENMSTPENSDIPRLSKSLLNILRPYQLNGVKFLWSALSAGLGVCLADDMGLGKTIQVLSWISLLKEEGTLKKTPVLLVVPATLLNNWRSEAQKFTPDLKLKILHPSVLGKAAFDDLRRAPEKYIAGQDAVLTTYGMITRTECLQKISYPAIIIDEAQAIKNPGSKVSKTIRKLVTPRRAALTGTPVENNLMDLWSLFDFINPGLLQSVSAFQTYVKSITAKSEHIDYSSLRRITRPFILRRLKTDKSIISDLPDKTEMPSWCVLSKRQAALYEKIVQQMKSDIQTENSVQRRGIIFSYLMQFKQICNHPAQFEGSSWFEPQDSGKFLRLEELAQPIRLRQEKMLIFTQYKEMTEPLHEFLTQIFGRPGLILHGAVPVKKRPELIRQFQSEDGPPFFVLSLKAAGTGLNLTAANHVVHFDRWWNPAVENQATDRAFRIGQKKNVLVHKFICKGTLEEKIDALISEKQNMADELLSDGAEKLLTNMSNDELLNFVKLDLTSMEN